LAEAGTPLPDFVVREFDAFTRGGDLRHCAAAASREHRGRRPATIAMGSRRPMA
jgi:hypothetical protein